MSAFNLQFEISHVHGVQRAVDDLKSLGQLHLKKCVSNSSGTIDIPGPGEITVDDMCLTIEDNTLRVTVRGNRPFYVTDSMLRDGIEKKLKQALD